MSQTQPRRTPWLRQLLPITTLSLTRRSQRRLAVAMLGATSVLAAPSIAAAAPAVPTGLKVSATGSQKVALVWNSQLLADPSITGYKVYRGTAANATNTLVNAAGKYSAFYLNDSTSLTNGTQYWYSVAATNASGDSAKSPAVAATPQAATGITTCGSRGSGHYQLTQSIVTAQSDCLTFDSSAQNTSLDCGGKTITETGSNTAVRTWGGTGLLVTNCKFVQKLGGNFGYIENGGNNFFAKNTYSSPAAVSDAVLQIRSSPSTILSNNTFTRGRIDGFGSPGSSLLTNTLTEDPDKNGIAISWAATSNTTMASNTISGGGGTANDDGIVVYGPSDHLVLNANTISGYDDAAIEPVGTLSGSQINDNVIHDVTRGVGDWYNTDFHDNWITGNQIQNSGYAFDFNTSGYNPNWPDTVIKDAQGVAQLSLQNNHFVGNKFTPKAGATNEAVRWNTILTPGSPAVLVGKAGNVFQNNYLGSAINGPRILEADSIDQASSTGNVCKTTYTEGSTSTPVAIGCGGAAVGFTFGSAVSALASPSSTVVTVTKSTTIDIAAPNGVDSTSGCTVASPFLLHCATAGITTINLFGAAGNDTLTLSATGVHGVVKGNGGDDKINAKNGVADTVDCGAGIDTASTDTTDTVTNCETVTH